MKSSCAENRDIRVNTTDTRNRLASHQTSSKPHAPQHLPIPPSSTSSATNNPLATPQDAVRPGQCALPHGCTNMLPTQPTASYHQRHRHRHHSNSRTTHHAPGPANPFDGSYLHRRSMHLPLRLRPRLPVRRLRWDGTGWDGVGVRQQ